MGWDFLWFRDPFVTHLRQFGYNAIRLPKAELKPGETLIKEGKDLNRLGALSKVFVPGINPLPNVSPDNEASKISGKRSGKFKLGIGLNILGAIIGAMGGSSLGLEAKYQQAKQLSFGYEDVFENKIELSDLDQFLKEADVNPSSSEYISKLLDADSVYIVTSTIKSNKFAVDAVGSNELSVKLDIPVIQQIVGANVKVSPSSTSSNSVTYGGKNLLVFGFQAIRLFFYDGRYSAFKPAEANIAMRDLELVTPDNAERLMTDAPFGRIVG